MKFSLIFSSILLCSSALLAQSYSIGRVRVELQDQSRNRTIPVEVYYPALTAGNNAVWADGTFPLVILGHGFGMTYSAYENLSDNFVPKGFVFAMIDTENGFIAPSHSNFGADYLFVSQNISFPGIQSNSVAYLGHSMGGGAAFLGAAQNPQPQLLIGLAPADTNPSAIAAASSVTCPVFVFSGEGDAVTPPAQNHTAMFNASASDCKGFISILGGAHCYFANSNFACDFGETASGSDIQISRAEQQDILNDFLEPLLNTFLKNNSQSFAQFDDSLSTSSRVSGNHTCDVNVLKVNSLVKQQLSIFPSPATDLVTVSSENFSLGSFEIRNNLGQLILLGNCPENQVKIDVSSWSNGVYYLRTNNTYSKIIKSGL